MDHKPSAFLFTATDNRGKPGRFDFYKAENGLIFIGAVPDNLGDYYEGGFDPIPADEAGLAKLAEGDEYKLEPFLKHKPAGRYLEIGPWIGKAAYHARNAGYDVTVLEQDQRCVDLLNGIGVQAIQTGDPGRSLEALRDRGERYDAIALWHSIEHLPRPWEVIDRTIDVLSPGGVLLVAAPNPESAQFRVFGKRWYHLDAPRHLYLLPTSLLKRIAQDRGLTVLEETTDDTRGVFEDDYGWWWQVRRPISLLPVIRTKIPKLIGPMLKRRYRTPGAADGATYTMIFQKPA